MLWRIDHLRTYGLRATDGSLGSVVDVFFDDQSWTVRWLVVDTAWLFGRRVLLPPRVLGEPDPATGDLPVDLPQDQIRNAPDMDTEKPVSRQHEADLYGYYGWDPYWGAGAWGAAVVPPAGAYAPLPFGAPATADAVPPTDAAQREADLQQERRNAHLRSGREIAGYGIEAADGSIGHIEDLLIDGEDWIVRYLIVDTGDWLPGQRVLIATDWIRDISWARETVAVDLTCQQVESSPEYRPDAPLAREDEERLHRHYGRSGYWI